MTRAQSRARPRGPQDASASTRRGTSFSATEQRATRTDVAAGTTNTPFSFIRSARSFASSANTVTKKPPS